MRFGAQHLKNYQMSKIGITNWNKKDHAKPERVYPGEKILTVPAQAMSIRQIYDRWTTSGQAPTGKMRPGHDQEIRDDEEPMDLVDIQKAGQMEMYEKQELLEDAKAEVLQKTEKLKAIDKVAKEKNLAREKEIQESLDYMKQQKAEKQKRTNDDASKKDN